MLPSKFDYIIIGNGMAGLKLALAFYNDSFFNDKHIALIDYSEKNTNDKTWCFWDTNPEKWQNIIHKQWENANFYTTTSKTKIKLLPYKYNMVHAIDFYNHCKTQLHKKHNFHFIKDEINTVKEHNNLCSVISKKETYTANYVFDSRIPENYFTTSTKFIKIFQHFKGWVINTKKEVFNTDEFTMMDYRVKYKNNTAFTYVLPLSKTSALVEFTFFTPFTVDNTIYDTYLKNYIKNVLNSDDYSIEAIEQGVIPMTNFPFHKHNTKRITKIGTAGGWVKPSSGYSFKLTDTKIEQLIKNIKKNTRPSKGLIAKKYSFYDSIFLRVLQDENYKGEWIFKQFYSKNNVKAMFSFLDETSTLPQDFQIITSLLSWSFVKALFKTITN